MKIFGYDVTFFEFPAKASTTGSYKGRRIGNFVTPVAYKDNDSDQIIVIVESNGSRVNSIPVKYFKNEELYEYWVDWHRQGDSGRTLGELLADFGVRTIFNEYV